MRVPPVFPDPLILRFGCITLCPSREAHYIAKVVVGRGVTLEDLEQRPDQWTREERRAIRRLYRPRFGSRL